MIAVAVALLSIAVPAAAAGKKAAHKDGRGKVSTKATAVVKKDRSSRKHRAGTRGKKERLVELTSLVATVDGVSVAPDPQAEVQATQLHRPEAQVTEEAHAAGVTTSSPSTGNGMLGFLVAALLVASLAAWLIRQMGPLRE